MLKPIAAVSLLLTAFISVALSQTSSTTPKREYQVAAYTRVRVAKPGATVALVERGPNQPAIVLFKNKRHTLTITVLQTHLQIAAYARLAAEVRALTYVAGRNTFLESKKFARFISL